MPTIDDIFRRMAAGAMSEAHEYIKVDPVKRELVVPEAEQIFGVETDVSSERKYFCCPATVGDNLPLGMSSVSIDYINAEGGIGSCKVDDVAINGDSAMFSWLLDDDVTRYAGEIKFALHVDYNNRHWNTTYATGRVLNGYC